MVTTNTKTQLHIPQDPNPSCIPMQRVSLQLSLRAVLVCFSSWRVSLSKVWGCFFGHHWVMPGIYNARAHFATEMFWCLNYRAVRVDWERWSAKLEQKLAVPYAGVKFCRNMMGDTVLFDLLITSLKRRTVWVLCLRRAPIFSYYLLYSMEQSPSWEANWFCS